MKGGDGVKVQIDTERLSIEIVKRFGNTRTTGLARLEAASQDADGKVTITGRTVRNLLNGDGWRNDTIERLCEVLGIHPAQILKFGNGDSHTHASPQPAKEGQQIKEPA